MRMLDNVIEYNYYSVKTARDSNMRHRPVGLGVMGFNDALYKKRLPYESDAAIQFADERSEEHTSELQSLMRISYAVFCLKKKRHRRNTIIYNTSILHTYTHSPFNIIRQYGIH